MRTVISASLDKARRIQRVRPCGATAQSAVFRHAIKLAKLQGQRELVQSHIGTWRLSNKRKQLSN